VLIVLLGSLFKIAQLARGGGEWVAASLGGVRVYPNAPDPLRQRATNVVEEMSIASGTPVPPLYLLGEEQGINAFAAGYSPDDATVTLTRGAVEELSRDQLQGVIAHEFSHILNGDMRLNIRLMGVLHGILVIGLTGGYVLRSLRYARFSSGRGKKGGGGAILLAILVVGGAMMVLGYIGTFFGNIIKAAVSRQREFLADAAAVQFTRNPQGIGGALLQIAARQEGSILVSPSARQASHMFFSQGVRLLGRPLATHPPLRERIRRVLPDWDGDLTEVRRAVEESRRREMAEKKAERKAMELRGAAVAVPAFLAAAESVGRVTPRHFEYAQELLESIPDPILEAAREPYGARAVVYALLVDPRPEVSEQQLRRLDEHADRGVAGETRKVLARVQSLDPRLRLPLVDLALGTLHELTKEQCRVFVCNVEALIAADERVELMEWVVRRIVVSHLSPRLGRWSPPRYRHYSLAGMKEPVAVLLSALAHAERGEGGKAGAAFEAGASALQLPGVELRPKERCSPEALDRALDRLQSVVPRRKKELIAACAAVIAEDREISCREAELLRAIADSLGCPIPPFLPGGPASKL
jgi:Zn-dependent protease with chaperone function